MSLSLVRRVSGLTPHVPRSTAGYAQSLPGQATCPPCSAGSSADTTGARAIQHPAGRCMCSVCLSFLSLCLTCVCLSYYLSPCSSAFRSGDLSVWRLIWVDVATKQRLSCELTAFCAQVSPHARSADLASSLRPQPRPAPPAHPTGAIRSSVVILTFLSLSLTSSPLSCFSRPLSLSVCLSQSCLALRFFLVLTRTMLRNSVSGMGASECTPCAGGSTASGALCSAW